MAHLHSWGLLALAAAGCQGEELKSSITGTDAAIAIDTAVDTAANADLPTEQVSPCVYDWIVPAEDPVYQASLPVEAPKILWSIDIDGSPGRTSAGLLLAGDHLVAWPDGSIVFVSKDGTPTQVLAATTTAPWSPATADKDGNIYIVSHGGIRSLKPDGSVRWSLDNDSSSVPCPPNSELCSAPRYPAPVLSSDGILFVVGPGAFLSALDSSSGTTLWRVSTPLDYYQVAADVLGGGGKQLLLRQMSQGWSHFSLLDKDHGTTLGQVERTCYGIMPSVLGWTMASMCSDGVEYYGACPALVDPSGLDWADSRPSAYLTVPGERLLATILVANKDGGEDSRALVAYNRDGTVAAGPWPTQGGLLAVGADGTVYLAECAPPSHTPRIIALSPDLQQLWQLDLQGQCGYFSDGIVLDDNGVLYLGRESSSVFRMNITALQTKSPGLARSSWPSTRHDNRRTSWMDVP